MALDKIVDSRQLDAALLSIANAIREKSGSTRPLNFPADFVTEIGKLGGDGLTDEIKQAILQLGQKVAYIDAEGQEYYNDLYNALYPPKTVVLLTAVFRQGSTVIYDNTALDDLRQYLQVTAKYDDNTTSILPDSAYSLSGLLEAPSSTVTVLHNGVSTTFTVTVTARPVLSSITADYTQSGTVYDTDTLDSLKANLVVTAVYSDSSTQTVAAEDYTLTGTLTAGTSTITVTCSGKTATFNVTVTAHVYTRSDYAAQDKMLLWLDGIDNTAAGHNAASTIWEDLSGNGHNVTYNDVGVISADHYNPNGKGCNIVTMGAIRTKIEAGTVEIVMNPSANANQMILPFGNTRGAVLAHKMNNGTVFVCVHPNVDDTCFESNGGVQTFNSLGYVDGAVGSPMSGNLGGSWATYMMNLIFCYKNTSSYPAKSDVYAVRIYDKELTAEEIALNAAVDRSRFGGS